MDSRKLMKGNIIQEIDKTVVTVEALPYDDFIQYSMDGAKHFGHVYGEPEESFEGLRITKDLLRLLGFKDSHGGLLLNGLFYDDKAFYPWVFSNKALELKYDLEFIHQLQNLYFSFTGEELTLRTP